MQPLMHWQDVVGMGDTDFKRYEEHRRDWGLRRDHQQDHAVLGRSGHPDRVGVHVAEPAHADAAALEEA